MSAQTSPWPSRLASVFSEDPITASERLSRDFEGRMSMDGRVSMDESHSTVSTGAGLPQHVTGTIAEEDEQEGDVAEGEQGDAPDWLSAAAAAANQGVAGGVPGGVSGDSAPDAGQSWNWAWLAEQMPPEHGALDPNNLLDDESEGRLLQLILASASHTGVIRPTDGGTRIASMTLLHGPYSEQLIRCSSILCDDVSSLDSQSVVSIEKSAGQVGARCMAAYVKPLPEPAFDSVTNHTDPVQPHLLFHAVFVPS